MMDATTAPLGPRGAFAILVPLLLILPLLLFSASTSRVQRPRPATSSTTSLNEDVDASPRRRLATTSDPPPQHTDLERALALATRTAEDSYTEDGPDAPPFRVLFIVTSLVEYDKGTRGTTRGADRLANVLIPILSDGVKSMVERGWDVDVYLILGFDELKPERKQLVVDALPDGVGLEVWESALPYYYQKKFNGDLKDPNGSIEVAPHGLSRQHRFVVKDKLMEYDFFCAFEDDMRIMADHVVNFLEMSTELDRIRHHAADSPDNMVHADGATQKDYDRPNRGKSLDGASVGNDVVNDPLTPDLIRRLIPGFVRVEVMDRSGRNADHPLKRDGGQALTRHRYRSEVPPSDVVGGPIDPKPCCAVPPGREKMPQDPREDDLLIWETDISAMGVRKYPGGIGWAAAMPVEDKSDVGSYWSGEGNVFGPDMKRPRRVNSLIGQQAGWMATRSQVLYFHEHACPGGFLPPFVDAHWKGDSLQRHAVEFWSGGYQLFGQCYFNRILSLDPSRFSRQLLYHTANNKQRTKGSEHFIRAKDFLGQLHTVRKRAERSLLNAQARGSV